MTSELHCKGCPCELCLPGHRAQMTRVYRAEPPLVGIVCQRCGKWCRDIERPCSKCARLRARKVAA